MLTKALDGLGTPGDNNLAAALEDIGKGLESVPLNRKQVAKAGATSPDAARRAPCPPLTDFRATCIPGRIGSRRWLPPVRPPRAATTMPWQFFLASAALWPRSQGCANAAAAPDHPLLLQLPGDDRRATIDLREYRKTLDALKNTSGIRAQ